jgi:hypothetical protein
MKEAFRDYGLFKNKNNEKILCLNVSRTYLSSERPTLYECTRKYWKLNGNRAINAELVFAVSHGYIVGVFKPTRWFLSEEYIGRWEFEGEQIEDSPYIFMDISHLLVKRQNPVMYINM